MKPKRKSIRKFRPVPTDCPFCKNKAEPDYKDALSLSKYVTDRAKILGRSRTGLCSKHQRRVTRTIKQARHVGLLAFIEKV